MAYTVCLQFIVAFIITIINVIIIVILRVYFFPLLYHLSS